MAHVSIHGLYEWFQLLVFMADEYSQTKQERRTSKFSEPAAMVGLD